MLYNFGFDTGDTMAKYIEPIAAGIVKKILMYNVNFCGSFCFTVNDALYDGEAMTNACADAGGWTGYWARIDDNGDTVQALPGESEFWLEGDNECYNDPPVGEQLWPPEGIDCWPVEMDESTHGDTVEVDLAFLGYPDTIRAPFFITAAVDEDLESCPDSWGIGAWGYSPLPHASYKNYVDSTIRGEAGWWLRSFDWAVDAEVEYVEDVPPYITDVQVSQHPFSTDPFEISAVIEDINPTGGETGVASAWAFWDVNEEVDSTQMTLVGENTYQGTSARFEPGDEVTFWVEALDVLGNRSSSDKFTRSIIGDDPNLFINNTGKEDWINAYYLMGVELLGSFPHDVWNGKNFGIGTYEVFKNYQTVVDVSGGGPEMCSEGLDQWLDQGERNYVVAGDDYLGRCFYGWPEDSVHIPPGDFAYDYLGLRTYYRDMNYRDTGDEEGVSRVLPVQGDIISGAMYDFLGDSLFLNYDPNHEIEAPNWLDGVVPVEGAGVSYYGVTGILDSTLSPPEDSDTMPTSAYYELPNGSKTAYFGFDALSLNTTAEDADTLYGSGYHWVGTYPQGPIPQALLWMNAIILETERSETLPGRYVVMRTYPNPFNPTTTIDFSVPLSGIVTLRVYDLLGREVETILNRWLDAGNHTVQWNATGVPSGIYFVKLQTADRSTDLGQGFTQVRKVTVLR